MERPMSTELKFVCLSVVVLAVAGCGGGDGYDFSAQGVSDAMTGPIEQKLPAGAFMDPLECVQDGDELHWRCLSQVSVPDVAGRQPLVISVVCDRETGRCISASD
jgi:hypothetical protein